MLLQTRAGRDGFAVLLFQDLAFIPLVALVPLLAGHAVPDHVPWRDVGKAVAAVVVDPGRRPLPHAAAVPRDRRQQDAGGVHHRGIADCHWHGVAGLGRGTVAVARRVHGGRAAVGIRIPQRAGSRHRAIRGPAARVLLHLRRHVGGPGSGTYRAAAAGWRDRRIAGCQDRRSSICWHAWHGRTEPMRCASPWRCPRRASSASSCSSAAVAAGRAGCGRGADGDAGCRRFHAGDADPVRGLRGAGDPTAASDSKEPEYDTHRGRVEPRDHRGLRPHGADRRSAAAAAWHRLHRAGTRPGPGRRGAPLWQQGIFRRSNPRRCAARLRCRGSEAAGSAAGRHGGGAAHGGRRAAQFSPVEDPGARAQPAACALC